MSAQLQPSCHSCSLPRPLLTLKRRMIEAVLAILFVSALAVFVWPVVSRFAPHVSANSSLIGLLFLGVVASVSTCLASTGAFMLAYAATGRTQGNVVKLHVGRLVAFVIGGGLLGAIGSNLPGSSTWYGSLAIVMGIGFLLVGLHLLGLSPSLRSFGIRLPSVLRGFVNRLTSPSSFLAPFLVGAATFVLPCGFTQTAQALALVSGSATRGALTMLAFAVGTLPVLFGATLFSSGAFFRHRGLQLVTGAMLFLFAFGQIDGGLTILGSSFTLRGQGAQVLSWMGHAVVPMANAQAQVVSMTVAYGAFTPNRFVVRRGVPVIWQIEGADIGGCASTIVVPTLGLRQNLTLGANEIQFTPKQAGMIPFSCSMGMIRGSFQVVE